MHDIYLAEPFEKGWEPSSGLGGCLSVSETLERDFDLDLERV